MSLHSVLCAGVLWAVARKDDFFFAILCIF